MLGSSVALASRSRYRIRLGRQGQPEDRRGDVHPRGAGARSVPSLRPLPRSLINPPRIALPRAVPAPPRATSSASACEQLPRRRPAARCRRIVRPDALPCHSV